MDQIRKLINKIIKEEYSLTEERENFNKLYHGTDMNSAMDIKNRGVDISKAYGGYFGWGFYTTPDFDLAQSNYADFSGDDNTPAVLEFKVKPGANILDLRDEDDYSVWQPYGNRISDKNLYKTLVNAGIDGLYDNSFEGVVFYNPNALELVNIHTQK